MKTQHKLKLAALLAIPMLSATWLMAEPPAPGGDRPPAPEPPLPGIEMLKDRLQLSDEQTSKIESVLTEDQKAEWKKAAERPRGPEGDRPDRGPRGESCDKPPGKGGEPAPDGRPGKPPGDRPGQVGNQGPRDVLGQLRLTEDQRAKVKEIFEANKSKLEAAKDAAQSKMEEVRAAVDSQIRPILTAEQQAVFDALASLRKADEALREKSPAPQKTK